MRNANLKSHILIGMLVGLFGLYAGDVSGQTVDTDTQRNGMHSCPPGQFVVGVRVDRNQLLCSGEFGGYTTTQETVQQGGARRINSQSHGMHACTEGMGMTGLHVTRNLVACAPIALPPIPRFVDTDTQRFRMHACPAGNPVSGIHVSSNLLLCGTQYRLRIISFTVDGNIQRGETATIRWNVECTAPDCRVRLSGAGRRSIPLIGSENVTPDNDTKYTLSVTSGGGRESEEKWVRVESNSRDRTVYLAAHSPFTGFPWWTGGYPTSGTLDGTLTRVANPPNSVWLGFLKSGYGSVDCGNPDAYVLLRPGGTMTEDQMSTLFGSSSPALPVQFVACSGAVGQPTANGGLTFPSLPLNITYTRRR